MSERVEGTIELDGLIEGQLGDDGAADSLRQWIDFTRRLGLRFNLDLHGGQFSLLPETEPVSARGLGDAPERAIAEAIQQLVAALPAPVRPRVFSTLRSAEYRKGEQVQAIYAVQADGTVDVQRRVVAAQTVAPPQPIDVRAKVRAVLGGLLVALAVLGVTSLFVDLRGLFGQAVDEIRPVSAGEIKLDAAAFDAVLKLKDDLRVKSRVAHVTLQRGPDFPADADALDAAIRDAPSARRRLALEALAKGRVQVELFDDEGVYYAGYEVRVRDLFRRSELEITMPLSQKKRTGAIVVTY